jgi:LmbE family N-acetylglucosaminyl deacetylase
MNKKVLVVSAHPDDETIGAGGTILKHVKSKDEVTWLIVTNIFERQGFSKEKIESRQKEIQIVSEKLGIKNTIKLDFPTMELDSKTLLEMIPKISKVFMTFEPEIIYCMNRSDAHSDHRVIFDAIMACTKSFRYPFVKLVLMYECISETEFAPALPEKAFLPNYFVDISEFINEKINILQIYASELGEHPFPRSNENILALSTFRGATVGVKYAEAFQLIKYIDK